MNTNDWRIVKGPTDIMLCGPGSLTITLKEFDRNKVLFKDGGMMGGTTAITAIQYPIDEHILLEITTVRSREHSMVKMHLGDRIQWTLPDEFAQELKETILGAGSF